jgi:hypothetical protein
VKDYLKLIQKAKIENLLTPRASKEVEHPHRWESKHFGVVSEKAHVSTTQKGMLHPCTCAQRHSKKLL